MQRGAGCKANPFPKRGPRHGLSHVFVCGLLLGIGLSTVRCKGHSETFFMLWLAGPDAHMSISTHRAQKAVSEATTWSAGFAPTADYFVYT
jgi:hypothetical protein